MRVFMSALALVSSTAYGHVPYVEGLDFTDEEAYQIQPPIERSLAIYLSFDAPTDVDGAVFTLKATDFRAGDPNLVKDDRGRAGRRVSFDTLVPACAPYAALLPKVALVGPAQAALSVNYNDFDLPFEVNEGEGLFLLENTVQGKVFKEPVSGTSYWQQSKAEFIVTKPGTYTLRIWEPQAQTGDYVLVFGRKEMFGVRDIIQATRRISYLRRGQEIKDESCRQELKP